MTELSAELLHIPRNRSDVILELLLLVQTSNDATSALVREVTLVEAISDPSSDQKSTIWRIERGHNGSSTAELSQIAHFNFGGCLWESETLESLNELQRFMCYAFFRRYGWSEARGHERPAEWGDLKRKLNEILDGFLYTIRNQSDFEKVLLAIRHVCTASANKPVIREQAFRHLFESVRCKASKKTSEGGVSISTFSIMKELIVAGTTDVWSAIRKSCSARFLFATDLFSLDQVEALFSKFVSICLDPNAVWQAKDGALLSLTGFVRKFRPTTRPESPLQKVAGKLGSRSFDVRLLAGQAVLETRSAGQTPDPKAAPFRLERRTSRSESLSPVRDLFAEDKTGHSQAFTPIRPTEDLEKEEDETCASVFFRFGRHRFRGIPDFVASNVRQVVYELLAHEQPTVRENARKLLAVFVSRSEATESYEALTEVIRRLLGNRDSSSNPPATPQLLDAYFAEGLLSVLAMLVRRIPPESLRLCVPWYYEVLSVYLAHQASTVRQMASSVFSSLIAYHCKKSKDINSSENSGFVYLFLRALSSGWEDVRDWEWKEGRLLAYELVLGHIQSDLASSSGPPMLSRGSFRCTPPLPQPDLTSPVSPGSAGPDFSRRKSFTFEITSHEDDRDRDRGYSGSSTPTSSSQHYDIWPQQGSSTLQVPTFSWVDRSAARSPSLRSGPGSSRKNSRAQMNAPSAELSHLFETRLKHIPRSLYCDAFDFAPEDSASLTPGRGEKTQFSAEYPELMRKILLQTLQCLSDTRWEVRRIASQVLPIVVQIICALDTSLLEEDLGDFVGSSDLGRCYAGCIGIKHVAALALDRKLDGGPLFDSRTRSSKVPSSPSSVVISFVPKVFALFSESRSKELTALCAEILMLVHSHPIFACNDTIVSQRAAQQEAILKTLHSFSGQAHGSDYDQTSPSAPPHTMSSSSTTLGSSGSHRRLDARKIAARRKVEVLERALVHSVHKLLPEFVGACSFHVMTAFVPLLLGYFDNFVEEEVQLSVLNALRRIFDSISTTTLNSSDAAALLHSPSASQDSKHAPRHPDSASTFDVKPTPSQPSQKKEWDTVFEIASEKMLYFLETKDLEPPIVQRLFSVLETLFAAVGDLRFLAGLFSSVISRIKAQNDSFYRRIQQEASLCQIHGNDIYPSGSRDGLVTTGFTSDEEMALTPHSSSSENEADNDGPLETVLESENDDNWDDDTESIEGLMNDFGRFLNDLRDSLARGAGSVKAASEAIATKLHEGFESNVLALSDENQAAVLWILKKFDFIPTGVNSPTSSI